MKHKISQQSAYPCQRLLNHAHLDWAILKFTDSIILSTVVTLHTKWRNMSSMKE